MPRTRKHILVDFDGTLATSPPRGHDPGFTGEPVWPIVLRVRRWLAQGRQIKIISARASQVSDTYPAEDRESAIAAVRAWTLEHLGEELDVVNEKTHDTYCLLDNIAVSVEEDTGKTCDLNGSMPE